MIEGPFSSGQWLDALAGGAGGFVKAISMSLSIRDGAIAVVVGGVCAIYLAPIGDAVLDPLLGRVLASEKQASHLGGFIVGMIGIGLVGFVMGAFEVWKSAKGSKQ
jgi:hypothetical protein